MTANARFTIPSVRMRWHPRDLLSARDLSAEVAVESRWRQLHVRALHQTWGIALGLHAASSDGGDLLLVGPGLAFDACQGELVLDHPLLLTPPVPPAGVAGTGWWFDLVARLEDGAPSWRWSYAGPWNGADAEPPLLAEDVTLGVDVPIARIVLTAAGAMGRVDTSHRRGTRNVGPRVASGRVPAGGSVNPGGTIRSWSGTIDLSAARFRRPPIVFVSLDAHPLQLAFMMPGATEHLLGPFVEIETVTASSVTVRVALAMSTTGTVAIPATAITSVPVAMRWLALEPHDRPEPAVVLARARTREGKQVANLAAKFTRLQAFPPPGGVTV